MTSRQTITVKVDTADVVATISEAIEEKIIECKKLSEAAIDMGYESIGSYHLGWHDALLSLSNSLNSFVDDQNELTT